MKSFSSCNSWLRALWFNSQTVRLGLILIVLGLNLLSPLQAQHSGKRVALVIGNSNYPVPQNLRMVESDVLEMSSALKEVGFEVTVVRDATQKRLKQTLRDFGETAKGADIAFIYYSGHGAQASGENYLIPIDASIKKEADYSIESVKAEEILIQMREAKPRATVLVLDACRDNPVVGVKGGAKGLARLEADGPVLISFATAPNRTAPDNGLYAKVLAQQIRRPGVELYDVFRDTRAEILKLAEGQDPRTSENTITDRIFLVANSFEDWSNTSVGQNFPRAIKRLQNSKVSNETVIHAGRSTTSYLLGWTVVPDKTKSAAWSILNESGGWFSEDFGLSLLPPRVQIERKLLKTTIEVFNNPKLTEFAGGHQKLQSIADGMKSFLSSKGYDMSKATTITYTSLSETQLKALVGTRNVTAKFEELE